MKKVGFMKMLLQALMLLLVTAGLLCTAIGCEGGDSDGSGNQNSDGVSWEDIQKGNAAFTNALVEISASTPEIDGNNYTLKNSDSSVTYNYFLQMGSDGFTPEYSTGSYQFSEYTDSDTGVCINGGLELYTVYTDMSNFTMVYSGTLDFSQTVSYEAEYNMQITVEDGKMNYAGYWRVNDAFYNYNSDGTLSETPESEAPEFNPPQKPSQENNEYAEKLPAPTGLTVSTGSYANAIKISWDEVEGADGYEIRSYISEVPTNEDNYEILAKTKRTTIYYHPKDTEKVFYIAVCTSIKDNDNNLICGEKSIASKGYALSTGTVRSIEMPTIINASDGSYAEKIEISYTTSPDFVEGSSFSLYRSERSDLSNSTRISGYTYWDEYKASVAFDNTLSTSTYFYYFSLSMYNESSEEWEYLYSNVDTGYTSGGDGTTGPDMSLFGAAFYADYFEATLDLGTELTNKMTASPTSSNYNLTVYGSNGGSATLNLVLSDTNSDSIHDSYAYSYMFYSYKGSNNSTIDGTLSYELQMDESYQLNGSMSGTLDITYDSYDGEVTYDVSISNSSYSGTITINVDGQKVVYDYASGTVQ